MRTRSRTALVLVAFAVTGCATTGAPRGSLPGATEAGSDPWGGWIVVEGIAGAAVPRIRGELLAVDDTHLWILPEDTRSETILCRDSVSVIPWNEVRRVRLVSYEPGAASARLWGIMGSVSALSHGVGMIVSLPLWILATAGTTHALVGGAVVKGKRSSRGDSPEWWDPPFPPPIAKLRPFARFPQGMPPGVVRLNPRWRPGPMWTVRRSVPATRSTP